MFEPVGVCKIEGSRLGALMSRSLLLMFALAISATPESWCKTQTVRAFDYPDSKRWTHRANLIAKAKQGLSRYPGIEVDVVYYQGVDRFDVRHRLLARASGLTLEELLGSLPGKPRVWIDFKNLSWWNARPAAKRLIVLMQRYDLDARVIVESKNARALQRIAAEGLAVSWWLPAFDPDAAAPVLSRRAADISDVVKTLDIHVVSAPHTYAGFLAEYLQPLPAHIWTNGLKLPRDEAEVLRLETMPNLRVILVDHWNE